MPFALRCPGCNALLKAPDKAAGRTLSCPGCKTAVTFPNTPPKQEAAPKPRPSPATAPNLSLDDARKPAATMPNLRLDEDFPPLKDDHPAPAPKPAAPARPAAPPKQPSDSILPDLDGDFPPLLGDDPAPPPKPAPKPAAAPKPAPAPVLPNLSLDDDFPLLAEDPAPAPKPAAPAKPAAPPKQKPAIPNLSLDDGPPAAPKQKPKKQVIPKMELEELPELEEVVAEIEDLDEVLPVEEEEEAVDQLEEITDHIDHVEEIPEAELDEADEELEELEELDEEEDRRPARRESYLDDSRLLGLRLIHVKAQKVSFVETMTRQDNAGHDLCDPESRRKVGEAIEVRDAAAQAMRYFVGRTVMETRVEIREGKHGDLLAVIRRPPYLWESSLEILDAEDRVLGVFERTPLSALTAKTLWIKTKGGKKLLQMRPQTGRGKMVLMARDGEPVGEMLTESAYEKKLKIYWMTRGCGYYVRFTSALDDRPEDKLRFLAAVIGLDLFMWEHMG